MFQRIRQSKFVKIFTIYYLLQFVVNFIFIEKVYGKPNGPSQPEMQGPSAANTDNLVDLFTGDLQYSIPLFEFGDIPLTLNYTGTPSMDEDASWVGLGWNINPGAITRTVRGLPDDFDGDIIKNTFNIKENRTFGASVSGDLELFGIQNNQTCNEGACISAQLGIFHNNYTGWGAQSSFSLPIGLGDIASLNLQLNGSSGSQGDLGISPSLNVGHILNKYTSLNVNDVSFNVGVGFSALEGLKSLSLGGGYTKYGNGYSKTYKYSGSLSTTPAEYFVDQTYTPTIQHSMINTSLTFEGGIGGVPVLGADASIGLSGYGSIQELAEEEAYKESKSYGYLHYSDGLDGDYLIDFNREKEEVIYEQQPNLPIGFQTYDLFNINAPGISGSFRAYRNDVGYINEPNTSIISNSDSYGAEFSFGAWASPGVDISTTNITSNSGNWVEDNNAIGHPIFHEKLTPNELSEHVYFAMLDEQLTDNEPEIVATKLMDKLPVRFVNFGNYLTNTLTYDSTLFVSSEDFHRNLRNDRNTNIEYLTVDEIEKFQPDYQYKICEDAKGHHIAEIVVTQPDGSRYVYGLPVYNIIQKDVTFSVGTSEMDAALDMEVNEERNLIKYNDNQASVYNHYGKDNYYNEVVTPAYAHTYLLTEILSADYVDVTGNGPTEDDLGSYLKYNYGIPDDDDADGIPDADDPDGDEAGDKYFYPDIENFKWRTPNIGDIDSDEDFDQKWANYSEGLKNDLSDDKANFTYGEKEIWYLHSIESKTYIAKFNLTDRVDALGVENEQGIIESGVKLKKINTIELFSKTDISNYNYWHSYYLSTPSTSDDDDITLSPIKTVYFKYDYSLCPGVPNKIDDLALEGTGKLTLLSVYFSYNNSKKAIHNRYDFEYGLNYSYASQNYNRWGGYKPNDIDFPNKDFPYIKQGDEDLNEYAASWCLNAINTPVGGRIEIEYEADDYAYVQNMPATSMYNVIGTTGSYEDLFDNTKWRKRLYDLYDSPGHPYTNNNYLIFELPNPIPASPSPGGLTASEADAIIKNQCIPFGNTSPYGVGENLYFRFLVNTSEDIDDGPAFLSDPEDLEETIDYPDEKPEYIAGYGTVDFNAEDGKWAGAIEEDGYYTKGYIKLKAQEVKFDANAEPQEINPITKAAWSFIMMNLRYELLDEDPLPSDLTFDELMEKLGDASLFESIISAFVSPNQQLKEGGFGKLFDPEKSMIRLGALGNVKKGGGNRVSKILFFDNWESMTKSSPTDTEFEQDFNYGVEYTYNHKDGSSYGVASYEPLIGADEIALRRPASFNHKDNDYKYALYQEFPFGESFFPAPIVGYSKVIVKNITREDIDNNVNGTGTSVYEFYTAKDFPVKVLYTELTPSIKKPDPFWSLFKTSYESKYAATQGYSVEINDMHGKPKSIIEYAQSNNDGDKQISKVEYSYFTDESGANLSNIVNTIDNNGNINNDVELGVKYDFFVDFRSQVTESTTTTSELGVEIGPAGPIPLLILPTDWPKKKEGYTSVNLGVNTKIISRRGILKQIITTQDGSHVTQENLFFDKKSGSSIITSTENEFEDKYYSLSYPSYWFYTPMGFASDNSGFTFESDGFELIAEDGKIESGLYNKLRPGDEIYLEAFYYGVTDDDEDSHYKQYHCWVYQSNETGNDYYLIDRLGINVDLSEIEPLDIIYIKGRVIRSGNRNLQTLQAGGIVSKMLPFDNLGEKLQPQVNGTLNHKIIAANAIEYSESWQNFCTDGGSYVASCNCNSELSTEGDAFITMLYSLYNEGKINEEIELYRPTELPNIPPMLYQCNFNSILYDAINAVENTIDWVPTISTVGANTIFNGVIKGQDDYCNFDINFGSTNVTDLQTACNNPENYNFSIQVPEFAGEDCNEIREFTITITNKPGLPTFNATGTCDDLQCLTLRHCSEELTYTAYCPGGVGDPVNPYLFGALGLWKPKAAYMYKTDRQYTYEADTDPDNFDGAYANIREDGVFKDYSSFWNFSEENGWEKNSTDWQFTAKSVLNNPFIAESENVNPLGIYSSSDFGYDNTLPIIVGGNAAYQEIGFENFEDEALFALMDKECNPEHFDFSGVASTKYAHTGNYSREIPTTEGSNYISYSHVLTPHIGDRETYPDNFTLLAEDCLPYFSPFTNSPAEKYIVTVWIKADAEGVIHSFDDLDFTATLGTPLSIVETKSTIIEGWQRIEYSFTIPANSTGSLELKFLNSGENSIYIDDIRVQPADALTNCYIYDFRTQKVMAELDENHYATLYEYDEEGKLIRVKKETERGIMTIQEGRYYSKKSN